MKMLNKFGMLGAVALVAAGCGGELDAAGEPVETPETGEVAQAIEYNQIPAMQTRDFSTWLTGTTTFQVMNLSYTHNTRYTAYCGGNSTSGLLAPRQSVYNSLLCNWFGARLYIRNDGTIVGNQTLDAWSY
ncbi:hypothetical protein [Pyxidicoccus trucidator]|uniref:hypothetical protein n=1 Tax=Pyxidicoccus trucidator TaxID=2709662 RepID=UPI0013D9F5F6|nr:hypothetical protein [Pyxidicoccus trucidator]